MISWRKSNQDRNTPSTLTMEFDSTGPILKLLLIIGGQPSHMESPKELLPFPDGRLAFEHALSTLHSAVPSASTIYVSIHDQSIRAEIDSRLKDSGSIFTSQIPTSHDDDGHSNVLPSLQVLNGSGQDVSPTAGIIAAHSLHPNSIWLVLSCDYPLLPASALQQLILEYSSPVTCFVNEDGAAQPLLGIWSPEALSRLRNDLEHDNSELNYVVKEVDGKLVRPLRDLWIRRCDTMAEWEDILKILRGDDFDA